MLAGAVSVGVVVSGGAAVAAAPATTGAALHVQAPARVFLVCDGLDAVLGCQYPSDLPYAFAGSYYNGGPYFAFDQPWFGDWWGSNWNRFDRCRWREGWGGGWGWRDDRDRDRDRGWGWGEHEHEHGWGWGEHEHEHI